MGVSSTFGSPLLTACLGGRRAAPRRPAWLGVAWLGLAWLADACKLSAVVHPARLVLSVGQRSYNAHLPPCNAHLPLCNAHLPAAQASLAWPAGLGLSTLVAAASSADHSVDTQPNAEIVLSYVPFVSLFVSAPLVTNASHHTCGLRRTKVRLRWGLALLVSSHHSVLAIQHPEMVCVLLVAAVRCVHDLRCLGGASSALNSCRTVGKGPDLCACTHGCETHFEPIVHMIDWIKRNVGTEWWRRGGPNASSFDDRCCSLVPKPL